MSIVIILRYGRVLWQLLRPKTVALLILQTLLVWVIVCGELPSWRQLTVIVVLISCWYMHAVAVNDLSDYEVDMINLTHRDDASDRPLVNQSSDSKTLWTILHFLEIILIGLWAAICMVCGSTIIFELRLFNAPVPYIGAWCAGIITTTGGICIVSGWIGVYAWGIAYDSRDNDKYRRFIYAVYGAAVFERFSRRKRRPCNG